MAIIPADEKVFMVDKRTNTTYGGSAALQAMQQWYTMQDISDSVVVTAPYKVYSALLNQSGTSAPEALVTENTIGDMTITRNSAGVYYFISPEFNSYADYGKVLCFMLNGSASGGTGVLTSVNAQYVPPINGIQVLSAIGSTLTPTDNAINGCSIEIRLYN
jgi:hypothetical protein